MAHWFREKTHVASYGLALTIVLSGAAWTAPRTRSMEQQAAQQWQLVKDWPRLPSGVKIGQVSGVAIDTSGHVMVFHRAGGTFDRTATEARPLPTVFEIDPVTGALMQVGAVGIVMRQYAMA